MSHVTLETPLSVATKTTVWYTRCPVPTAFGVALRAGLLHEEFREEGDVILRSVLDSEDPSVHDSHYTGNLRNAFRQGGNIPPIWARSRGADTRVLGVSWTTTPAVVLALPGSGIRAVSDLKGKRLHVVRRPDEVIDFLRAGTLHTYEAALATAGLGLGDVALVDKVVGGSTEHSRPIARAADVIHGRPRFSGAGHRNTLVPFIKGEVDAIAAQGPFAIELIESFGAHVVYDTSKHPDPAQRFHNSVPKVLTADARFVDERSDLVNRLLVRLLETAEWAKANFEQAVHYVALEQGSSDALAEAAYGPGLASDLELNLDPINLDRLNAQKAFLLRHGFIEKDFDLGLWIAPSHLKAARAVLAERRSRGPVGPDSRLKAPVKVGPAGCVASR